MNLQKQYFTTDGYWTVPNGIYTIMCVGAGGGGGGAQNLPPYTSRPGSGGGGSLQQTNIVSVSPGDILYVTIGQGGFSDCDGYATTIFNTISLSTIFYAAGASKGWGRMAMGPFLNYLMPGFSLVGFPLAFGGGNAPNTYSLFYINELGKYIISTVGGGGIVSPGTTGGSNGIHIGGSPGSGGSGGAGGGAGPQGNGGNGGNYSPGTNGFNAANNTGAGGGGAGDDGDGATLYLGGKGGSGYLYIVY